MPGGIITSTWLLFRGDVVLVVDDVRELEEIGEELWEELVEEEEEVEDVVKGPPVPCENAMYEATAARTRIASRTATETPELMPLLSSGCTCILRSGFWRPSGDLRVVQIYGRVTAGGGQTVGRLSKQLCHRGAKVVEVQIRRCRCPNDGILPDSEDVLRPPKSKKS
jgi:hypothetical protein